MPDISPFSIATGVRFGDPLYKLILSGWGNYDQSADGRNIWLFRFPDNFSAHGLAIAPTSTVDRVTVRSRSAGRAPSQSYEGVDRHLSIGNPIHETLRGPIYLSAGSPDGFLRTFGMGTSYVPFGAAAPVAFERFGGFAVSFIDARLEVLCGLRPRALEMLSLARSAAVFNRSPRWNFGAGGTPPNGTEGLVQVHFVPGRSRLIGYVRSRGAGEFTFRLMGLVSPTMDHEDDPPFAIQAMDPRDVGAATFSDTSCVEVPVFPASGAPHVLGVDDVAVIDADLTGVDFLLVYVNRTAGAVDSDALEWQLVASD